MQMERESKIGIGIGIGIEIEIVSMECSHRDWLIDQSHFLVEYFLIWIHVAGWDDVTGASTPINCNIDIAQQYFGESA